MNKIASLVTAIGLIVALVLTGCGPNEVEKTATTAAVPSLTPTLTLTPAPTPTNRAQPDLVLGDNETGVINGFSVLNVSSFSEYKVGVLGITAQGESQGEIIFLDPWVVVQVEENLWASYDLDTHQIVVWSSNPDEEALGDI